LYRISSIASLDVFLLSERGRRVVGVELRHLTGQPGGGGV
jgi:hypothetical protein